MHFVYSFDAGGFAISAITDDDKQPPSGRWPSEAETDGLLEWRSSLDYSQKIFQE